MSAGRRGLARPLLDRQSDVGRGDRCGRRAPVVDQLRRADDREHRPAVRAPRVCSLVLVRLALSVQMRGGRTTLGRAALLVLGGCRRSPPTYQFPLVSVVVATVLVVVTRGVRKRRWALLGVLCARHVWGLRAVSPGVRLVAPAAEAASPAVHLERLRSAAPNLRGRGRGSRPSRPCATVAQVGEHSPRRVDRPVCVSRRRRDSARRIWVARARDLSPRPAPLVDHPVARGATGGALPRPRLAGARGGRPVQRGGLAAVRAADRGRSAGSESVARRARAARDRGSTAHVPGRRRAGRPATADRRSSALQALESAHVVVADHSGRGVLPRAVLHVSETRPLWIVRGPSTLTRCSPSSALGRSRSRSSFILSSAIRA